MSFGAEVGNLGREFFSDCCLLLQSRFVPRAPPAGEKPKTIPRKLVNNRPRDPLPSSHYYLRSLSWTSRTFYFQDSRDLLEVLRDVLGRERGGLPRYRCLEVFDLTRIRLRFFDNCLIRAALEQFAALEHF